MKKTLQTLGAVVAGLVGWAVVASVLHVPMKLAWPAYVAVLPSMSFSLAMMIARLLLGAAATLAGGYLASWVAPADRVAAVAWSLGLLLLLFFVPTHLHIWSLLPIWYHLTFLGSLVPLTLLGAKLRRRSGSDAVRVTSPG